MVKKYILLVFLLMFINSLIVFAADNETSTKSVDKEKGYAWLFNESKKVNWGGDAETVSWVVLALKNNRNYDYKKALDKLEGMEDDSNWNDDIYETALATIALKKTGKNVDSELEWLFDRQEEVLESGNWFIQFLTEGEDVSCKVIYEDEEDKEFVINGTEIVDSSESCSVIGENWVDFEECVKDDDADMYEKFETECLSGSNVKTSILFKNNANYYIVDQDEPLEIENSCFYGNSNDCSCISTQYASWAMSVVNDQDYRAYTLPYLRSNCNENVLDNIFLYMLTSSEEYYNYLISDEGQLEDGSFDGDEYKTALALIAMKGKTSSDVTKAVSWLGYKQRQDGSWDGSVKITATVLYALTADVIPITTTNNSTSGCGDLILNNATEQCEYTSDCDEGMTCSACKCVAITGCVRDEECTIPGYTCQAGKCLPEGECAISSDCDPGEICVNSECDVEQVQNECVVDEDCIVDGEVCESGICVEQGSSWITWLIVFLIVIVALIGAYFGYKKFFRRKGSPKGTGFKPNNGPFTPRSEYSPTRQNVPVNVRQSSPINDGGQDKIEEQLDQSLKKARELLRGK